MSEREISEICRYCNELTGGVEAGNAVRWTNCTSETQQQTPDGRWICSRAIPDSSAWMPRWLRKLLPWTYRASPTGEQPNG